MSDKIPISKHISEEWDDSLPYAEEVHSTEPTEAPPPVPTYNNSRPSAPPHQHDSNIEEEQQQPQEFECPVCFDSIQSDSATMRCSGSGGQPHFFHAHCLNSWITTCQDRGSVANCPICRGSVEIHTQRLEQFLNTIQPTTTENIENISVGRRILTQINNVPTTIQNGWNSVPALSELTQEDVIEGASIVAGAGIGFIAGSNGAALSTGNWMMDNELWNRSSTATRVSTVVGYVAGIAYSYWSTPSNEEEEENERRRRRRRDRRR
tara:strand:+ start:107 stop:901 length:795 start_codon:yes stop_codon:yes gene_type:complete